MRMFGGLAVIMVFVADVATSPLQAFWLLTRIAG